MLTFSKVFNGVMPLADFVTDVWPVAASSEAYVLTTIYGFTFNRRAVFGLLLIYMLLVLSTVDNLDLSRLIIA